MKKLNYHQRQDRLSYPRTITTNRKRFCGLLLAGFFVFMVVFGANAWGNNIDKDGMGVIEPAKDNLPNSSGAYTTSIPIALPKARGNIGLSLAISYNSNAGNGKLGIGWGLSGIPSIVRTGKRKGTLEYNTNDEFYFNGMRLWYDSVEDVWHTQKQSYLRIKAINNPHTATVSYWEITSKNGTTMYLGGDDSSTQGRIYPVNNDIPRLWSLYKIEDVNGNTLTVTYGDGTGSGNQQDLTNGDCYVEKIEYNGGGKIIFNWESRDDKILSYRSASKVEIDRKLDYIEVNIGSYRINKYDLTYTTSQLSSARSLLQSIKVYGTEDDTTSLPATQFDYYGKTEGWDYKDNWCLKEYFGTDSYNYHVRIADVNGDGLQDVIRADEDVKDIAYLNTGNNWPDEGTEDWESPIEFGRSNTGKNSNVRIVDLNGDGLPDILKSDEYEGQLVSINLGDGWDTPSSSSDWIPEDVYFGDRYSGKVYFVRFADLNGDGLTDIIRADEETGHKVLLNRDSHWSGADTDMWESPIYFGDSSTFGDYGVRIFDINGDGLPDIVQSDEDKGKIVYLNNGNGWAEASSSFDPPEYFDNNVKIADLNGDGLPDIIKSDDGSDDDVYLNTGDYDSSTVWNHLNSGNNWESPVWFGHSGDNKDYFVRLVDLNGDGLSDIVQASQEDGHEAYLNESSRSTDRLENIYNSIGGRTRIIYCVNKEVSDVNRIKNPVVVDAIHQYDNLGGPAGLFYTSYAYYNCYFDPDDREFRGFAKVKKIDPTGNTTETHYHQDRTYQGLVEKSMRRDSINGNIYDYVYYHYTPEDLDHYGYRVGIVHSPLLAQVDTYVVDGSTTTDTWNSDYEEWRPAGTNWKRVQLTTSYTSHGDPNTITNYGLVDSDGDDIGHDKVVTEISYARDPATWVVVPSQKVASGYNNSTWGDQLKERYYYDGALTSATSWLDFGSVDTGHLKCVRTYKDGSNFIDTKRLAYDVNGYGNVTKVLDANGNDTTTTYDSTYDTYLKTVTNTLDHVTTFGYDDRMQPISVEDPNGQVTWTQYDALGRVSKVWAPLDHDGDSIAPWNDDEIYFTKRIDYQFNGTAPEYTVTLLREKAGVAGCLTSYTYIDGLGRTIQTKREGLDGEDPAWITVDNWSYYEYVGDTNGDGINRCSVTETSAPYFAGGSSFSRESDPNNCPEKRTKTVSYLDSTLGKISWVEAPDETDGCTYSQRLVTTTRNARNYGGTSTVDGLGNVIETKVYSDTYPFDSLYRTDKFYYNTGTGQLVKKVEDDGGANVITTMTYDLLGRNTSTNDPDSGTWNYYYDSRDGYTTSYGNLIGQIDAKGNEIKIEYDALNRVIKKDFPSETDTYFYYDEGGSAANENGMLTRVTDASGSTVINYDSRGRISSEVKMISGLSEKTTSCIYDTMDRIDTITYPDGEVVKQTYGSDGSLDMLGTTSDTAKYAKDIDYDAFGKMTRRDYQNGAYTSYSYYGASGNYRLKNITAAEGDLSPAAMINYEFDYDAVGNIIRIDGGNNNSYTGTHDQEFTYDHLSRLTAQTNANYAGLNQEQHYVYDAIDRIMSKTGVGDYSYSGANAGPHAVTGAAGSIYSYDANGNMSSGGGNSYTYDSANHLVEVSGSENSQYSYDSAGNRVKKVENGVTTYYINAYYEVEDGAPIKYYYANGQRIAKNDNEKLSFYHTDHLGGSAKITDSNGTEQYSLGYKPYGSQASSSGSSSYEPVYKFTGKEEDSTGLYYYGARYYDPALGRFISPDNYGDDYTYCGNNPVNRIDPSGNSWVDTFENLASNANQVLGGEGLHVRSWDEISSLGVGGNLEHMGGMLFDHNDSPLIAGTLDAGILIGSLAIPLGNAAYVSQGVKAGGVSLATKAGASQRTAGFIGTALQNMQNSAVLSGYLQYTIEGKIDAKDVFVDAVLAGATSKGLRAAKKGEHLTGVLKPLEPYVQKLARSNVYRKYIGRGNDVHQNRVDIRTFIKGSYQEALITPIREVLVNDRAPTLDTLYSYGLGRIFGFGAINVGHLYQHSITMGRTYNKFLKEPAKVYFMQD